MFWTLVVDNGEAVESTYRTEVDGLAAFEAAKRKRATWSATLWQHVGSQLVKVADFDRGDATDWCGLDSLGKGV